MKPLIHHIRVPAEQFAYLETDFEGTAEEAVTLYQHITFLVKGTAGGLPEEEWRAILDDLLEDQSINGDPGSVELMSPAQRYVVNEIKKSFKRINK